MRCELDHLDAAAKTRLKDEVFGRYLQVLNLDGDRKGDQLTAELKHFVDCVRTGNRPRVSGTDGRDAWNSRSECSPRCGTHPWEGTVAGPLGPGGLPAPAWLPVPAIADCPHRRCIRS